jgi:hypothetical protein
VKEYSKSKIVYYCFQKCVSMMMAERGNPSTALSYIHVSLLPQCYKLAIVAYSYIRHISLTVCVCDRLSRCV